MDLVRLFHGSTVVLAPIPNEPKGLIFNKYLNNQVINMLQLVYLATLSQITKSPNEERIISAFDDAVSSVIPETGSINLGVGIDKDGKVNQLNISEVSLPLGQIDRKKNKWKSAYKLVQTYPVRKFSKEPNGIVSLIEREKDDYSRMFKLMRGRYPLTDAIGARFILYDLATLIDFETKLKEAMPEWVIEKEPGETVSTESVWQEGVKYKVCWQQYPNEEFELGIYWLKNTSKDEKNHATNLSEQGSFGNWAQNLFGYKENFHRYRIQQLLNHVLPFIFPSDDFKIDWTSDEVKTMLFDHAHQKAKASALVDFPD